jgi:hypothetical protein
MGIQIGNASYTVGVDVWVPDHDYSIIHVQGRICGRSVDHEWHLLDVHQLYRRDRDVVH